MASSGQMTKFLNRVHFRLNGWIDLNNGSIVDGKVFSKGKTIEPSEVDGGFVQAFGESADVCRGLGFTVVENLRLALSSDHRIESDSE